MKFLNNWHGTTHRSEASINAGEAPFPDSPNKADFDDGEEGLVYDAEQQMFAFFTSSEERIMARIERAHSKILRKKLRDRIISELPKLIVLSTIVMLVTIFVFSNIDHTAQRTLSRFAVEKLSTYTSISPKMHLEHIEAPQNWSGHYFPCLMPQGCTVSEVSSDVNFSYIEYSHLSENVWMVIFIESSSSFTLQLDTENVIERSVIAGGYPAEIVCKNNLVSVYWDTGSSFLLLTTRNLSVEDTLTIADSVDVLSTMQE